MYYSHYRWEKFIRRRNAFTSCQLFLWKHVSSCQKGENLPLLLHWCMVPFWWKWDSCHTFFCYWSKYYKLSNVIECVLGSICPVFMPHSMSWCYMNFEIALSLIVLHFSHAKDFFKTLKLFNHHGKPQNFKRDPTKNLLMMVYFFLWINNVCLF